MASRSSLPTGAVYPVCSNAACRPARRLSHRSHSTGRRWRIGGIGTKYRKPLLRYPSKLSMTNGCRPIDLEHIAGLALDKVRSKAGSYTPRGKFRNWLYKLARNLLFDELKRARREKHRVRRWHTTRHGSAGTRKRNVTSDYRADSGWNTPQLYHTRGGWQPVDNNSPVVDVYAWNEWGGHDAALWAEP